MTISIGGQSLVDMMDDLRPQVAIPAITSDQLATRCFINGCELKMLKIEVSRFWDRWKRLMIQIEEKGEDHPKIGLAWGRADTWFTSLVSSCVRYTYVERQVDHSWREMRRKDREDLGSAELLEVPAKTPHLLGSIHTVFTSVPLDPEFQFPRSVLHFVPPLQEAELEKRVGTLQFVKMKGKL